MWGLKWNPLYLGSKIDFEVFGVLGGRVLRLDSGLGVSLGCPCGCKKATEAIEIATDAPCYEF
jgi:hypothetical protein